MQFISKLSKSTGDTVTFESSIVEGAKPESGCEDFYEVVAMWGGEENLIRLVKSVVNHTKWLNNLPKATEGNEAEWRARTWDRILIEMEEHFFNYAKSSEGNQKLFGDIQLTPNVFRYL